MSLNGVKKAFDYFGPQVCQDKVRSFLTPGYRVMKADSKNFVKFKPTIIVFHEYDELNVNMKEFTRQFEDINIQINAMEEGGMEIVAVTNFPELVYTSVESNYKYQGVDLIIHSYKSKIVYNYEHRVLAIVFAAMSLDTLCRDIVDTYASELFTQQIVNHNGDRSIVDELRKSTLNKKRAVETLERINNLGAVHHIVDS